MSSRPNVICIMSDEHDPAVMGCYGDSIVQTPNLDRLADEGITCDNAYTTSPLCVPARLSFTAGKYISRCGAWSNNCRLPSDDYPSLPRLLNSAGYESILGGKMHYDAQRRYGFKDLFHFKHGQNYHNKTGTGGRRDPEDTEPVYRSWNKRSSNFYTGNDSYILEFDRDVTEHCCGFLKNRSKDEKPFFLLAGYLAPHFPLVVPEEYFERYKDRVPEPDVPEGFLEGLPTNYKQLRYGFGVTDAGDDIIKKGRELYWGLVNWLDDEIGKLMQAFHDSDVADNTVVIYTSDHGEDKGDHGMWWKNCMYEHAARIPLIFTWPGRWQGSQRRNDICSMVDLTQTIADICGVDTPDEWNGESMLGCLDDEDNTLRGLAVSEYYAHNISSGFAMLRKGDFKYVYHTRMDESHGPETELYNLQEDPKEFNNLADQEEYQDLIQKMHNELVKEVGRDPEEAELECRRDYEQGYNDAN